MLTMVDWWRGLSAKLRAKKEKRVFEIRKDVELLTLMFERGAYHEARRRSHIGSQDDGRHWRAVAIAIAKQTGRPVGLDTETRMSERDEGV